MDTAALFTLRKLNRMKYCHCSAASLIRMYTTHSKSYQSLTTGVKRLEYSRQSCSKLPQTSLPNRNISTNGLLRLAGSGTRLTTQLYPNPSNRIKIHSELFSRCVLRLFGGVTQKNVLSENSCGFHTSSSVAANPAVGILVRTALKGLAPIFGRLFRRWWFQLEPKRQRQIYESVMDNKHRLAIAGGILGVVLSVYLLSHIEKTPYTGRLRLITINRHQMEEIAEEEYKQLLILYNKSILPSYDSRVRMVTKTARKLIRENRDVEEIRNKDWKVYIVDSPVKNMFVVPGKTGAIFAFTGMLDLFENEDQLGIVLGHEMAHAVLGHGLEKVSFAGVLDWLMIGGLGFIWAIIPTISISFVTSFFYDKCIKILLDWPYSRTMENEADAIGLEIATKACFDVREGYAYWCKLAMSGKMSGEFEVPAIVSTHPSHGSRAQRLDKLVPKALELRQECACPPLKRYDPRVLADYKKQLMEQELAARGQL